MPFHKGQPKSAGRTKGTKHKSIRKKTYIPEPTKHGGSGPARVGITKAINEVIDGIISLDELFGMLADLARSTSDNRAKLDAIKTLLAYRIGKPADVIINKSVNEVDDLQKIANIFANTLMEVPNVEQPTTGSSS